MSGSDREAINDEDENSNAAMNADGEDLPDKSKVYFDDDEKTAEDGDEENLDTAPGPASSGNTRKRRTGSDGSNRRSKKLDTQNVKKSEKNVEKKQEGKEDTEYYFDDEITDSNTKHSKQADDDSTDL